MPGISYTEFSYICSRPTTPAPCIGRSSARSRWAAVISGGISRRNRPDPRVGAARRMGSVGPLFTEPRRERSSGKPKAARSGSIRRSPRRTNSISLVQRDDRDVESYLKALHVAAPAGHRSADEGAQEDPSRREAQGKLAVAVTSMSIGKQAADNARAVKRHSLQ